MNLEIFLLLISHILFLILGYLLHDVLHKHFKKINSDYIVSNQEYQIKNNTSTISNKAVEKIKKIHIDTSRVVVNDIDNNFEKCFDTMGNKTTSRDNISEVVNRLSQLKNNGGNNG